MKRRVFCTVGTTSFDKLIDTIIDDDTLKVLMKRGYTDLKLQIGSYKGDEDVLSRKNNYALNVEYFRYQDSISECIKEADLVISHAGAGSCLEVLSNHRPLIVVINEDLMNNHQVELAQQLHDDGHVYMCTCRALVDTLTQKNVNELNKFPDGDPQLFRTFVDQTMFAT